MTRSAKAAVAEVTETLAAQALIDRGAPAVKARGGKARLLHIVDAEGKPTGKLATHGQVLAGVAKVAEIELTVIDGKRPERIICVDCDLDSPTRVVYVPPRGGIPKRCIIHAADRDEERRRARLAKHPCATAGCERLVCKEGGYCSPCAARARCLRMSPEARRAMAACSPRTSGQKRTPEQRKKMSDAIRAACAAMTPEQRSERARKAYAARATPPAPRSDQ